MCMCGAKMHTRTHTFPLHTHSLQMHFLNNCQDKSLWDLPGSHQTAPHAVPIRLSLDTQQSKNNMAALKKPPRGKETGQSGALLFYF